MHGSSQENLDDVKSRKSKDRQSTSKSCLISSVLRRLISTDLKKIILDSTLLTDYVLYDTQHMLVKSPKQSLGDLLFLLRFFLLLLSLLLFSFSFSFPSFSFLSEDHELVHGRSQEILDRIS